MSTFPELFSGGKPLGVWLSGTTYKVNDIVVSSISGMSYMRRTSGAGATDPSSDKVNWKMLGAGKIKSIQRGIAAFPSNNVTLIINVSAVDMSNSLLSINGAISQSIITTSSMNADLVVVQANLSSSSQITFRRFIAPMSATVSWELVEYWS